MPRTEKYFIGPSLLGDIRDTVDRVKSEPYRPGSYRIPTKLEQQQSSGGVLRLATFTASWNKFATKTITFSGTSATAIAVNVLATVPASCGDPRTAVVAQIDGVWHLIAAECAY